MAYEIRDLSLGTLAAPTSNFNSSTKQFTGVAASTVPNFFAQSGTTLPMKPVGILQNKPRINESGEVWVPGCISKLLFKTAIGCGSNFIILNTGLGATTASAKAHAPIYGPVLETATSGAVITVSFSFVGMAT